MSEYPDSGAPRDNLLDAGEDQGRVDNLERNLNAGTGVDTEDKA
jgi:cytochrome c oxidase subunit 1